MPRRRPIGRLPRYLEFPLEENERRGQIEAGGCLEVMTDLQSARRPNLIRLAT